MRRLPKRITSKLELVTMARMKGNGLMVVPGRMRVMNPKTCEMIVTRTLISSVMRSVFTFQIAPLLAY